VFCCEFLVACLSSFPFCPSAFPSPSLIFFSGVIYSCRNIFCLLFVGIKRTGVESRTTVWGFKITIINDNFHLILGHGKKNVQNPDDTDSVKSIYSHITDILFS